MRDDVTHEILRPGYQCGVEVDLAGHAPGPVLRPPLVRGADLVVLLSMLPGRRCGSCRGRCSRDLGTEVGHRRRQRVLVPAHPLDLPGELHHLVEAAFEDVVLTVRLQHPGCCPAPLQWKVPESRPHREPAGRRRGRVPGEDLAQQPELRKVETPHERVVARPADPALVVFPPARQRGELRARMQDRAAPLRDVDPPPPLTRESGRRMQDAGVGRVTARDDRLH